MLPIFHPPESHVEVLSVYHQEQQSHSARFCNTGAIKKTRVSLVHRGRSWNRPSTFCTSASVGTIPQRLRLHARSSTSYTVCLDKFNSLAIIATFFFSAFILRIIACILAVTLLGMPFGPPPLLMTDGVPPALRIASILACFAAWPAAMRWREC